MEWAAVKGILLNEGTCGDYLLIPRRTVFLSNPGEFRKEFWDSHRRAVLERSEWFFRLGADAYPNQLSNY